MRAVRLHETGALRSGISLRLDDVPLPTPTARDVLVRVSHCGVCHTELDEIEGRAAPPRLPMTLGHQAVGRVEAVGRDVHDVPVGKRVGVAWIFSACGKCRHCHRGNENLCADFQATGRDADGGYADYLVAPGAFVHVIPEGLESREAAPLLCAGAIGYRSLRLTGIDDGLDRLGLTGFGASAHLVLKLVRHAHPEVETFVFARDRKEREFALELGATWAGDTVENAPAPLDAIIDTTPAYLPVLHALRNLAPGGRLVINALRKRTDDQAAWMHLDYARDLWLEKEIKTVANVTRRDVRELLKLAMAADIAPTITEYALEEAPRALSELRAGQVRGAKVLVVNQGAE
jgi:propanol-preferring alcohol dehydrogenase